MISNVCVIYRMKFSILQKFGFKKIQKSGRMRQIFFWNLLVLSLRQKYLKSWIIANFIIICFQIHEYPSHPVIWLDINNARQSVKVWRIFPPNNECIVQIYSQEFFIPKFIWNLFFAPMWSFLHLNIETRTQDGMDIHGFPNRKW